MNSITAVRRITASVLLASALLMNMIVVGEPQTKIKLYTFYTPSHKAFLDDWFIPTLQAIQDDGIELIVEEYPQECETGIVFSSGWQTTMLRKVKMMIKAMEENPGHIVIYSDCDIQFFRKFTDYIKEAMEDKDLLIQRDTPSGTACAGFYVLRSNERTIAFWKHIRDYMIENKVCSDQKTLNKLLRKGDVKTMNPHKLIWDYLPATFLSGGTLTGSNWSPGKNLFVPRNIVLHHANWTKGDHKFKQLKYVREKFEKQNVDTAA